MQLGYFFKDEDIMTTIYKRKAMFSPALQRIADYILANTAVCKTMTIHDLATAVGVTDSTVTRFVKELPLKSFQELKIKIAETLSTSSEPAPEFSAEKNIFENINPDDSVDLIAEKICYRFIDILNQSRLTSNFEVIKRCANLIDNAECVYFCCTGSSCLAADEAHMRLTRVGKKCTVLTNEVYQHMSAAVADKNDLFIGISNSGRTSSVIESLALARERGASTVALTAFKNSPLARQCTEVIITPTQNNAENKSYYWDPSASNIAQIYIIDLVYSCYAALHFEKSIENLSNTYNSIKHMRTKS